MLIIGVDLAWGDRKPDGVCSISCRSSQARVVGYSYPKGDDALLHLITSKTRDRKEVLVTIDAPIICPTVPAPALWIGSPTGCSIGSTLHVTRRT